jgi:NAD(P)-dependent dehydrogenase (short-subunit alcohol dehydrogenase family)
MPTALIWGASGGIGRALAGTLKTAGWTVAGVSRHPGDLTGVVDHAFDGDTSDDYSVRQTVLAVAGECDAVDLWVYAAGDIASSKVAEMAPAVWQQILGANLTGAYLTTHHSGPLLAEQAHLVYIGAYSENLRLPGLSAYAAAKAGLEAFVTALGKEERRRRVTLVRPGAVNTPFWQKMPVRMPRSAAAPEEIAAKILGAHESGHSGTLDL